MHEGDLIENIKNYKNILLLYFFSFFLQFIYGSFRFLAYR